MMMVQDEVQGIAPKFLDPWENMFACTKRQGVTVDLETFHTNHRFYPYSGAKKSQESSRVVVGFILKGLKW